MTRAGVTTWNLALSAGACAVSWAVISPLFAGSLALGALFGSVNFRALWRSSERVLLSGTAGGGPVVAAFGFRFVLIAIALWVALRSGAHPVGLVMGLSMMVPAVVAAAWRGRPLPHSAGPAPPPDDPSWDEWNPWLAREREPDADGEEA